jgi:hypothetical protein
MVINTTTWEPDTCDCVILQNFDYAIDTENPQSISFQRICSLHQGIADHPTRYDTILNKENRPRMQALLELLLNAPTTVTDTLSDGSKKLKDGIEVHFSFTGTVPNRLITLTLTGVTLTANQKTAFQTRLDNRFGAGKITLVN